MKRTLLRMAVVVLGWMSPVGAQAAGFAHNSDFVVLADDQALAEAVLAKAAEYRKELARDWLGEELPPAVGRATINVTLSANEDRGLTWPLDRPGRGFHRIWLTTSRERALGSTLKHELAHAILATRYPDQLPPFASEAVANLYDDAQRAATRETTLSWFAKTGNWPSLREVFEAEVIPADDTASYSVATSLAAFLMTRADGKTFLDFAVAGRRDGWDSAARQYYRFVSVEEMQRAWQSWAAREIARGDKRSTPAHATSFPVGSARHW